MATRERPLSPHLQIYRRQVQMMTSIIHRATGIVLAVGGLVVVWGLAALAGGPETWARFSAFAGSPLGWIVWIGGVWSLSYHLINGVRHLLQDAGMGFAVPDFVRSSWISVAGSVLLALLVLGYAASRLGAAA